MGGTAVTSTSVKTGVAGETIATPPEIATATKLKNEAAPGGGLLPATQLNFGTAHTEFAEFHQAYVSQYIALADTKAAWSFALTSGILGYLISVDSLKELLQQPLWAPACVLFATVIILLFLSSLCSFLVIAPRLSASGEGLVFFRYVAAESDAASYARAVANASESELTHARIKHSFDLSRVCTRKYDYLIKAMWLGLPALWGAGLMLFQKP